MKTHNSFDKAVTVAGKKTVNQSRRYLEKKRISDTWKNKGYLMKERIPDTWRKKAYLIPGERKDTWRKKGYLEKERIPGERKAT